MRFMKNSSRFDADDGEELHALEQRRCARPRASCRTRRLNVEPGELAVEVQLRRTERDRRRRGLRDDRALHRLGLCHGAHAITTGLRTHSRRSAVDVGRAPCDDPSTDPYDRIDADPRATTRPPPPLRRPDPGAAAGAARPPRADRRRADRDHRAGAVARLDPPRPAARGRGAARPAPRRVHGLRAERRRACRRRRAGSGRCSSDEVDDAVLEADREPLRRAAAGARARRAAGRTRSRARWSGTTRPAAPGRRPRARSSASSASATCSTPARATARSRSSWRRARAASPASTAASACSPRRARARLARRAERALPARRPARDPGARRALRPGAAASTSSTARRDARRGALAEAARVLRPGGGARRWSRSTRTATATSPRRYGHVHAGFRPAALRRLLAQRGPRRSSAARSRRASAAQPHFEVVTAFARKPDARDGARHDRPPTPPHACDDAARASASSSSTARWAR